MREVRRGCVHTVGLVGRPAAASCEMRVLRGHRRRGSQPSDSANEMTFFHYLGFAIVLIGTAAVSLTQPLKTRLILSGVVFLFFLIFLA